MQSIWIGPIMTLFAKPDRKVLPPIWLAAALALVGFSVHAQDYPKRPITMIVPFAAGGTSDVIARTVAEQMAQALGQPS
jgi:tripartite-type tricarboxylate transporter receptor subunit TctC